MSYKADDSSVSPSKILGLEFSLFQITKLFQAFYWMRLEIIKDINSWYDYI